ncbi:MAG: PLDc N-terminal domain-containing protein [Cellvibrio sp.]
MSTILSIIWLVIVIYAVVKVIGSNAPTLNKLLWTLGIIIFPVVGVIVWYFAGPKS